jgi:hypothetical protein
MFQYQKLSEKFIREFQLDILLGSMSRYQKLGNVLFEQLQYMYENK